MSITVPNNSFKGIPEDPQKVSVYGWDPDREMAYIEAECESFERTPFLIPGYTYQDCKMIPIEEAEDIAA